MEPCISESVVCDLVARRGRDLSHVQGHLDACPSCRALVAELVRAQRPSPLPRATVTRARPLAPRPRPRPAEADEPEEEPLTPGAVVATRFELVAELGRGATGVVWQARNVDDGSPVALKFLRARGPDLAKRLRREGAVLRALRHPSIVAVSEVVEDEARGPVLVMELVSGTPLSRRLAGGATTSLEELAPIVVAVLDALRTAHAHGVVHRDLKPDNVLLPRASPVAARVVDFGMAKLDVGWQEHGLTPGITPSGAVMGTPLFMAPEQCFGEAVGPAADLWALGVLCHRALTGRFPIEARTFPELLRALADRAVQPFAPGAPFPEDVRTAIASLLSFAPEARLAVADTLLRTFARLVPRRRP